MVSAQILCADSILIGEVGMLAASCHAESKGNEQQHERPKDENYTPHGNTFGKKPAAGRLKTETARFLPQCNWAGIAWIFGLDYCVDREVGMLVASSRAECKATSTNRTTERKVQILRVTPILIQEVGMLVASSRAECKATSTNRTTERKRTNYQPAIVWSRKDGMLATSSRAECKATSANNPTEDESPSKLHRNPSILYYNPSILLLLLYILLLYLLFCSRPVARAPKGSVRSTSGAGTKERTTPHGRAGYYRVCRHAGNR